MKTLQIFSLAILAMIFAAACEKDLSLAPGDQGIKQMAAGDRASVEPELVSPWQSGDAYAECLRAGGCGDFAWKINENPGNQDYNTSTGDFGNAPVVGGPTITISNNTDGTSFDWAISAGYEVCAVIVKAGPDALVYSYDGATSDAGLYSPTNPNNGNRFDISHVTFCFREADAGQCYEEETAWAEGPRYVPRGNWAMYVPYAGVEKTVNLIAGQNVNAGDVTFSAPDEDGMVTITVNLTGGAIFYYDAADMLADENLKIQDYATAPNKTPKIGHFDWKWTFDVGTTTATVEVPQNNFYGVHVDLALVVPCE